MKNAHDTDFAKMMDMVCGILDFRKYNVDNTCYILILIDHIMLM